jgi:predicted dienelactone hydrolase
MSLTACRIRLCVILLLGHFLSGAALQAQEAVAGLSPGPWPVGFTHLALADSTRPSGTGEPRRLDGGVWYPAKSTDAARLTYRDYFLLTGSRQELDDFVTFLTSHDAPGSAVEEWLGAPMLAASGAPRVGGPFPLVMIAQGNAQTIHDQAPLAEYLAGHGYVVATVPSPMRISGPLTDESEMGLRADEQSRDLEFLWAALVRDSTVVDQPVGIVGHSFGARAALLLAMRDARVGAVVSQDGGIGTATGRASLEAVPSYRASGAQAPILHFYERLDPLMTPDFGVLRSLVSSRRWLVQVPALHHHHFTSLGAASIGRPALRAAIRATAATAQSYSAVAGASREFLDMTLKRDLIAERHLQDASAWVPLGPVQLLEPDPQ